MNVTSRQLAKVSILRIVDMVEEVGNEVGKGREGEVRDGSPIV